VREPKPAAPLAARLLPLDEAEETGTFARF
jgi:hypothetical protein